MLNNIGPAGLLALLFWVIVLVVPFWKLWQRTGHSGWWGVLMIVPLANIIALWVLAFKDWPALRGRS
jgi:hypothetical protein